MLVGLEGEDGEEDDEDDETPTSEDDYEAFLENLAEKAIPESDLSLMSI